MKKCRLMALDLDGTLLNGEGELTPFAREALLKAHAEGVHVIAASGRALDTFPKAIRSMKAIRYVITSNGAAVYRMTDGSCIRKVVLAPDAAEKIMTIAEAELGEPLYEAFVDGKAYSRADYVADPMRFGSSEMGARYVKSTRNPVEDMEAFIRDHASELDCLDILENDPVRKERVWKRLETEIEGIYITTSVPRYIEISGAGTGKGKALAFLCSYLGVDPSETAAFGNADNDSDMLKYAALGIAVANADPGCLSAADRIAGPNTEDGAAKEILRILQEGIPERII